MDYLRYVVVGVAAGWIAGVVMRGRSFGLVGDLVVGVVGAFAGAFLANGLGISAGGIIGRIAIAAAGAIVLLVFARLLKRMQAAGAGHGATTRPPGRQNR